jgi:crotonobetainyl-CoA:carnitine CoA-transferase CaiB-like acyl-CoA transferase
VVDADHLTCPTVVKESSSMEFPGIASLTGLRVVDVTTNVAGPFATQILGDLGADVIKVERPGTGDDTRGWGPPFWPDGESVTFSSLNRNKRSIALDLTDQADVETFVRLVETADVLVENMRAGAFAKLGFDWTRLKELNPRLVYARITGYGARGALASRPAYDPLMQAWSGLMSLNGHDESGPARVPVSLLDKGSGMWAVIGILNALRLRDRTGSGSEVVTSLLDTALTWEASQLAGIAADGQVPRRLGSATPGIAPYQAFQARDAPLVIAAGNQRLWERLCESLGRRELLEDPRFATNRDRFVNREDLVVELESVLRGGTAGDWVDKLTMVGIPCSVVRTVDQVVSDSHVVATGALVDVALGAARERRLVVSLPLETDGQRFGVVTTAPALDEHGDKIRGELA